MSYYIREYFNKDNTIVKDSTINLGKNPVSELFYGGTYENPVYSRYIFHFDENKLKELYENCYLGDLSNVTHTLKIKPTWFFGDNDQKCLASSYKLCLFKLEQEWDEGCGYSYDCKGGCEKLLPLKCNAQHSASNWLFSKSDIKWENEGGFLNESGNTLSCIYTSCDSQMNDYLEFDVTTHVNSLLTGDTLNYGYGIALAPEFENYPEDEIKYIGFYSKDTNTYFQPFLETRYNKQIKDNRYSFYLNKENNLYLHFYSGSELSSLDENPIVNIISSEGITIDIIEANCISKGIYEITVLLTGNTSECMGMYEDHWTNLKINGVSLDNHIDEFEVKNYNEYFKTSQEILNNPKFAFKVRGIRHSEKIKKGEIRKLFVDPFENFNNKKQSTLDSIYYRLYVKQGVDELNIIDWSLMEQSLCQNWTYLDTSWMIEQEYWVDFKIVKNNTEIVYPNQLQFFVI